MLLLSYPLSKDTPLYGNAGAVSIQQSRSIAAGDTANALDLHFSNHSGTHIDAPYHFDQGGKKITEYEDNFWFCRHVLSIESLKMPQAKEQLGPFHLKEAMQNSGLDMNLKSDSTKSSFKNVEALLWKTGWCRKRSAQSDEQKTEYSTAGPGMSAELADELRALFPNLRFFGFDLISLSSFANREEGRRSHRAFLCHEHPILPIEDMDLHKLPLGNSSLKNLLISPLLIEDGDGAPVSVWVNLA